MQTDFSKNIASKIKNELAVVVDSKFPCGDQFKELLVTLNFVLLIFVQLILVMNSTL